jgi:hypothetical protein
VSLRAVGEHGCRLAVRVDPVQGLVALPRKPVPMRALGLSSRSLTAVPAAVR